MDRKLLKKVVVITGAGRGIGRIIAEGFALEGAKLVLISRTMKELKVTASCLRENKDILLVKADISKEKEVRKIAAIISRKYGTVDVLVNNAGVLGPVGMITDNKASEWFKAFTINVFGTYLCSRYLLPFMIKNRSGKIINLGGGGAASPKPFFSSYAASKAAVLRFTENLSEELKSFNIQVNAIAPGGVKTKIQRSIMHSRLSPKEAIREAKEILSGKGTEPSKIIELAIFLATKDSDGLTGKYIHVNDLWRKLSRSAIKKLNSSDLYSLRRINLK